MSKSYARLAALADDDEADENAKDKTRGNSYARLIAAADDDATRPGEPDEAPEPPEPILTAAETSAVDKSWYQDFTDLDQWRQAAQNVGQVAGSAVSGIGATGYGALHGYVTNPIARAIGLSDDPRTPHEIMSADQQRLTYQPTDESGQELGAAISKPYELVRKGVTALGGEGAGDVLDVTAALSPLKSPLSRIGKGPAEVAAVRQAPGSDVASRARNAGYKLTPTQEKGGVVARSAEGLADHAKLERELSMDNQHTTNQLAKKAIGLAETEEFSQANIAKLKDQYGKPYAELSKLGKAVTDEQFSKDIDAAGSRASTGESFPLAENPAIGELQNAYRVEAFDSGDAVKAVRQLRSDSSKNIKAPNDPEKNAKGYAQRKIADAIEGQLERHAEASGKPELVKEFRHARQQLAKIHDVEDALTPAGNVDAKILAKKLDKGAPFSDELKTIAETAATYPRSLQATENLRNTSPVGMLQGLIATTAAGAGAIAHSPEAMLTGGLALVAPAITRKILANRHSLSKLMSPGNVTKRGAPRLGQASVGAAQQQRLKDLLQQKEQQELSEE